MKKMKKIMALVLALTMVFTMNLNVTSAKAKKAKVKGVKVTSVTGSKKVAYVAKGKSVKLSTVVNVKPNKKANKAVKYKVSNRKVATVSKKGVVKGKKVGTTKVTVISKKNSKKKKSITIKVVKSAVKKVTLNKKRTVVGIGSTEKLKAKVTAPKKGSFKAVAWKSSNKKVATVSNKGVVKGVKEGTVKITAFAADGSKKKAVCTVTVGNSISKVEIANELGSRYSDAIKVSLSSTQALDKNDFTVNVKSLKEGEFKYQIKVGRVLTVDNKNYIILLNEDVSVGDFVKVTANKLKGNKSAEVRFLTDATEIYDLFSGVVNDEVSDYVDSSAMVGYSTSTVESGSLPNGLTFDSGRNLVKGTVKSVTNNQIVMFKRTDELGRVQKVKTNFLYGDDNTLVAENKTVGANDGDKIYAHQSINEYLRVRGGSGSYKFELLDTFGGAFKLDEDEGSSATVYTSEGVKAGTYNVRVKAIDEDKPSLTAVATLTVVVSESYEVKVNVKSENDANIVFFNTKTGDRYGAYSYDWSEDGKQYTSTKYLPKGDYMVYSDKYGVINVLDSVTISGNKTLNYTINGLKKLNVKVYNKDGKLSQANLYVRVYNEEDVDDDNYTSFYKHDGTVTITDMYNGKYVLKLYNDDTDELIATSNVITVNNETTYEFRTNLAE